MKKIIIPLISILLPLCAAAQDKWPDGTPVDKWFTQTTPTDPKTLGKQYVVTDYGVVKGDSTLIQTEIGRAHV